MLSTLLFFFMASPDGSQDSGLINLIFLGGIFFVFYFFIIRPQSKKQKEIRNKVEALKKNDKVITSSGIIGTISTIEDDSVLIEISTGVKVRFLKSAISDVNPNKPEKNNKKDTTKDSK